MSLSTSRSFACMLAVAVLTAAPVMAQAKKESNFDKPLPPHKVIGNIYYVGTADSDVPDHHARKATS